MVVVVAVAYGAAAPQLAMAEFAPSARQSLEPPPTTTADAATGAPGGPRRRTPPSTATTVPPTGATTSSSGGPPATTTVGRARKCYGDPPRQLPDPRSPACAPTIFEGDNGGATGRGVTETEIRVGWISSSVASYGPGVNLIFDYLNRNFEFYGRRLVPVALAAPASTNLPGQRAFAQELGSQNLFAVLEEPYNFWYPGWYGELARQGIVSIAMSAFSLLSDREVLDQLHPYVWTVFPSTEQRWANQASFICSSLARGRKATHAGPSLVGQTRSFGLVAAGTIRAPSVRSLVDELAACGVELHVQEWVSDRDGTNGLRTALGRLQGAGVTTLMCACADFKEGSLTSTAKSMGWLDPEWLLPMWPHSSWGEYYVGSNMSVEQRSHLFGLQPALEVEPTQAQWWFRAAREVNPVAEFPSDSRALAQASYEELLVLAAGIQAAGPDLSADTFALGLAAASFPGATVGGASGMPSVGFGPGDHSFYNDYALAWWSATATTHDPFANPLNGSWCYLGGGTRFTTGRYPTDADSRFFDPAEPCR